MAKTPARILLLKNVTSFNEALEDPDSCVSKAYEAYSAKLYWTAPRTHTPRWVENIFPSDHELQNTLKTQSISAVLLVKHGDRFLAITFGHGKNLLKQAFIEPRFGLKVVLNRVDPNSLRSIDTKSLDGFLSQTREQVPTLSPLSSFGIDIEKDFIRAVTGTSTLSSIGQTITGSESFYASINIQLDHLEGILDELLSAYDDNHYRESFEFIDNIAEVRPSLSNTLNLQLVEKIVAGDHDRIWLAPPEIMDWENHGGFSFYPGKPTGRVYDDISLDSYLDEKVKRVEDLSLSQLKNHKIYKMNAEFEVESSKWPVFKCLYAELEDGTKRYILSDGKWFEVEESYVSRITNYLRDNLDDWSGESLPEYRAGEMATPDEEGRVGETRYNAEVAPILNYDLLDTQMITHGGANSKIELCDLHASNLYIHIKRYTRSSGLSHLFNQGKVSAELLCSDPEFRAKASAKINEVGGTSELTSRRPNMQEITVTFGVISSSSGDLKLPFFSQVALKNSVHFLKHTLNVGRVSLIKIQAIE